MSSGRLQVTKLGDLSAINERCMDLQQTKRTGGGSKSRKAAAAAGPADGGASGLAQLGAAARRRRGKGAGGGGGCPYLPRRGDGGGEGGAMEGFKGAVLAATADVEELARMGRSQQVCSAPAWRPPGQTAFDP
jgi:hypothetical protein